MTHEENSLRTKKALADSLKKLMEHKTFSKITVSELIRDCNLNRKTFYYHFEDIYALLNWMLNEEAMNIINQFKSLDHYEDAFLYIINYVDQNSFFLNCLYDSVGRDELKVFLHKYFIGIVNTIITTHEDKLEITIPDDFRHFLCIFYTEGIAGMLINLLKEPTLYSKDTFVAYMLDVVHNSIPSMLQYQTTSI